MARQLRREGTRSGGDAPGGGRRTHAADTAHVAGLVTTGLFALFTTKLIVRASAVPPGFHILVWVAIGAASVVTLLFLTATVSARTTRAVGRILLIVASSLGIAYTVSFTTYTYVHGPAAYGAGDTTTATIQLLLGVALPAITLLAAALSPLLPRAQGQDAKREPR